MLLIDLIWKRTVDPGKVFDLELPLAQAAEGYRAKDERRPIDNDIFELDDSVTF